MLRTAEKLRSKISAWHLERCAYVYVRQSAQKQVRDNHGSRENQYALVERAIELGWHEERVRLVDDDQGISAKNAGGREGFKELVGEVSLGYAGIVLAYEASRLARNNPDWYALLYVAAVRGTLIADSNGVYRRVLSDWFIMSTEMDTLAWNHGYTDANRIMIHYVRHGSGSPLILLHGWPEFWYTFRKNIPALAARFDVVAPDLRGFGDTEKPGLPSPPSGLLTELVEDLLALADALGFEQFGLASHDVGAYVAQAFTRRYPERLSGLFFFNCPYPGIGDRWAEADTVNEI